MRLPSGSKTLDHPMITTTSWGMRQALLQAPTGARSFSNTWTRSRPRKRPRSSSLSTTPPPMPTRQHSHPTAACRTSLAGLPGGARLAKLWGFRMPETRVGALEGAEGIAQEIPKGASLVNAEPDFSSLTEREVSDIAREHVLDWMLDNPGSLPGTFYSMPDGSIVGAGKGQALLGV